MYNALDPYKNTTFRTTQFEDNWLMGVQHHVAKRAGDHRDLRLFDPKTGIAHSFAMRRFPEPGEKVELFPSGDHTLQSMGFSGVISKGRGTGTVSIDVLDKIEVLEADPKKVTFVRYTGSGVHRYTAIDIGGRWLLLNTTATNTTRPEVPLTKRQYATENVDKIDLRNPDLLLAPKLDGAHVAISLRPERRIDVFSYRPSKKSDKLIDHSFKTDLYKTKVPKSLGTTVLRGELFGVDKRTNRVIPSSETGGLLNSGTWKSREEQAKKNVKLEHLVFDIERYKNKDVSNLPYREKLKLLQRVKQELPQLNIITPATTYTEKFNLLDEIKSGKNPLTREGVVIYDVNKPTPSKVKFREDIDVYFSHPFEPKPNSRLARMGAAGGFYASRQPGGEPNIRVGTGLSDQQRVDIMTNANNYKNMPAKVLIHEQFNSGKVRVPTFREWRYEQWEKTGSSKYQTLKNHKVPLSPEERQQVMDSKAIWHHGPNGEETPAVWKSVIGDKTTYITNTHRAYQAKPTLKGAISAYHEVIKKTASTPDTTKAKLFNPVLNAPNPDPRIEKVRQYILSRSSVELATLKNPGKAVTNSSLNPQPAKLQNTAVTVKKSSVIDPVQKTLDPDVWDLVNLTPLTKIKFAVFKAIKDVLGPDTLNVSAVKLLGAQTTYNWSKGGDIDVNVGFYPTDTPSDVNKFSDIFKATNPHIVPGIPNPINLFAVIDSGEPQQYNPENVLALYDLFSNTWIKQPDPAGVDTRFKQELLEPYTNIYEIALSKALFQTQHSKNPLTSKFLYLVELYKKLDRDRKLSYQYGWGVPNVGNENISYKKIMRDVENSEIIERMYKSLKPSLLKGWLNI